MSKCFQLFFIFTLISITAGGQTSSPAAQAPVASSPVQTSVPSYKDALLKKLWSFYFEEHFNANFEIFKSRRPESQAEINNDPKLKEAVKAHFYERFVRFYNETLTLEEMNYLNQLYSSGLMKRVNSADQKVWERTSAVLESFFNEAVQKSASAPSKVTTPANPKIAPKK